MAAYDAIIVGSGAASYSTADWLFKYGIKNSAIVTENRLAGTSRNTGSDKQTYYKMSMVGASTDSNLQMAEDIFNGGSVNGDTALIEASNSARCFMRLVEYGMPFPTNEYGEYVGYKTDHDNTARATSCGPLTSKLMTECLEKKVVENGVTILDKMQVVKIVVRDNAAKGVIVIDNNNEMQFLAAANIILATGGEASIYRDSVYPLSQTGATALGIEAGAVLHNFQEWQYGMSATKFRWNVSGSYQQVIPRYIAVDTKGQEREFLLDSYAAPQDAYNMVFLKGYQWPFDYQKMTASSRIDLLVYEQILAGKRVYLDFTTNAYGYNLDSLSSEAQQYLKNANCVSGTPYQRLHKLNPQAIDVFSRHGINLAQERLEIAICAQHNNGGFGVDSDWQTNIKGLFAVGEAAGTFGVYRAGGSALNSTQVGGLRVAEYLAREITVSDCKIVSGDGDYINDSIEGVRQFVKRHTANCDNIAEVTAHFKALMSEYGGICRDYERINDIKNELQSYLDGAKLVTITSPKDTKRLYKCMDMLICDYYLCKTIIASIANIGSRGGALAYIDGKMVEERQDYRKKLTLTSQDGVTFVDVKPLPTPNNNFETILNAKK